LVACKSDSKREIWDAATPTVNERLRVQSVGRLQIRAAKQKYGMLQLYINKHVSDCLTVVVKSWRAFCPTEISRSRPIVFTRCHETCKSSCFAVGGGAGGGGEGGWGVGGVGVGGGGNNSSILSCHNNLNTQQPKGIEQSVG
jgi:hypothetical protein